MAALEAELATLRERTERYATAGDGAAGTAAMYIGAAATCIDNARRHIEGHVATFDRLLAARGDR